MTRAAPQRHVLRGVWLLATFRREGFGQFQASREAYLSSLIPIFALLIVAAVGLAARFGLVFSLRVVLLLACGVLAPQVVSHFLAGLFGRGRLWLGYSVAFNWSQWAIPLFGVTALFAVGVLTALGLPDGLAASLARVGIAGYALALYVFVTRHGLGLSLVGAIGFIVAVNLACSAILLVPDLIEGALD
jgi:hypothetical protein